MAQIELSALNPRIAIRAEILTPSGNVAMWSGVIRSVVSAFRSATAFAKALIASIVGVRAIKNSPTELGAAYFFIKAVKPSLLAILISPGVLGRDPDMLTCRIICSGRR